MPLIFYSRYSPVSDRIPEIEAQEHALGRQLLSRGLDEVYGISISPSRIDSHLEKDGNGKPYLSGQPEICFNISHCSGLVVCAFDARPVGVDAEMPGYFAEILIQRALSASEKDLLQRSGDTPALREEWFYRLWTLKEAYVKMSGQGVDTDLTRFSFSFEEHDGHMKVGCSDPAVACFQEKLPSGHIISLCYTDRGVPVLIRPVQKTG